jgi:hypothetical protein
MPHLLRVPCHPGQPSTLPRQLPIYFHTATATAHAGPLTSARPKGYASKLWCGVPSVTSVCTSGDRPNTWPSYGTLPRASLASQPPALTPTWGVRGWGRGACGCGGEWHGGGGEGGEHKVWDSLPR